MKIFIDTSSLLKKYHAEEGSKQTLQIIKNATRITVSPVTYLEIINTIHRFSFDKKIRKDELESLCQCINNDFQYFSVVPWDEELKNLCIKLATTHRLKTLDIIQLGSGIKSTPQIFVTSDKKQHQVAQKEFKNAVLID